MDNVRPRYRFQYDMSINDTPLTRALEKGDFTAATVMIKNSSSDPEFLNEGPYERFPLYIVVSGMYCSSELKMPNLQVAKLLLEHGAQANKRGTVYNDMDVYSHSETAMELLVRTYSHLQLQCRNKEMLSPVIGLDGLVKVLYDEIREHLLGLMQVFIAHGGRISFRPGILGITNLVNFLWTSPDVDFLRYLYEAGVDMNHVDVHGRTALHLLCQVQYPPDFEDMRLKAISYLLENTNIEASKYSCLDHSCIWYALKNGHFGTVSLLLAADPSLDKMKGAQAFLTTEPEYCHSDVFVAERLPPVLVAFVPMRDVYLKAGTHLYPNASAQEKATLGPVSMFVDQGFFCDANAESIISKLLDWNPNFQMHRKMLSASVGKSQLVPFLFGRTSSKLKILCARQIFESCLLKNPCLASQCAPKSPEDRYPNFCDDDDSFSSAAVDCEDKWCLVAGRLDDAPHHLCVSACTSKSVFDVTFSDLVQLLGSLRLPASFVSVFEFELYRRKLLLMLLHSDSDRLKCMCLANDQLQGEDMSSEESSSSNETSSEEEEEDSDISEDHQDVSSVLVNLLQ